MGLQKEDSEGGAQTEDVVRVEDQETEDKEVLARVEEGDQHEFYREDAL